MASISYQNYLNQTVAVGSTLTKWLSTSYFGQKLVGSSGADQLEDAKGGGTLVGGSGDDFYLLGKPTTTIVEAAGGGIDSIKSWVNATLPANVEWLTLAYDGLTATSNDAGGTLVAAGTLQTLVSGKGADVLVDTGGGRTIFSFLPDSGKDVIYGFKVGDIATRDFIKISSPQITSFDQVLSRMTQVGSDTLLTLSADDSVLIRDTKLADFTEGNFLLALDTSQLKLSFADEFDSLSLYDVKTNTGVWDTVFPHGDRDGAWSYWARTLVNNHELQLYVDPSFKGTGSKPLGLNPFSIQDGVLEITASRTPAALDSTVMGYDYLSGLLTTQKSFAQTYGYFEMRAELPSEKGMFPAFWLVTEDGSWPPELDIMEQVGGQSVYHTAITQETGSYGKTQFATLFPENMTGFHTYGVLWTAETITWYIDGIAVGSVDTPKDMNEPMVMRVNLAVGGDWAGAPDSSFVSDSMKVDYIRAYTLESVEKPVAGAETAPVVTDISSCVDCVLEPQLINLTLTGTAAIDGTGNALGNTLIGNDAANRLIGGAGDDLLDGRGGNDILDGGAGADRMIGGAGNDSYHVDAAGDVVVEYANGGTDTVYSSIDYTLGGNVENLVLQGSGPLSGTGNALANSITGGSGDDRLFGLDGNDMLTGGAGNDLLDGGKGNDVLTGGAGDDVYVVDTTGDKVIEAAGGGIDTVRAGMTYTLPKEVENLVLLWSGNSAGTGNELANRISGNGGANVLKGFGGNDIIDGGGGNDVIWGGTGNDVLTGGSGSDRFVFERGGGKDVVTDFGAGGTNDIIDISAFLKAGIRPTITDTGADTLISFNTGDSIRLLGIHPQELQPHTLGYV
jgi:Ca2+-binding RTX toxin-like protein/beta-glucanase (GH16 family)